MKLAPAVALTCTALVVVFGGTYYLAAGNAGLSQTEATDLVIAAYGTMTTAGPAATTITVEAISPTSNTEAIARTHIGDQPVVNVKFRRFDDGWHVEFIETKTGGWTAAAEYFRDLRDQEAGVLANFERVGPNQYRRR